MIKMNCETCRWEYNFRRSHQCQPCWQTDYKPNWEKKRKGVIKMICNTCKKYNTAKCCLNGHSRNIETTCSAHTDNYSNIRRVEKRKFDEKPKGICYGCIHGLRKKESKSRYDNMLTCDMGNFYLCEHNDHNNTEVKRIYEARKEDNKCSFFESHILNHLAISPSETKKEKKVVEMVSIDKKIENVKYLIEKVKDERRKRIENSHISLIMEDRGYNRYRYRFTKKFVAYMNDQAIEKKMKKRIKNFVIGTNNWKKFLVRLDKEEWELFSEMLVLVEHNYDKFVLNEEKKKLCYYTDCYKELSTEETCPKCKTTNPKEAVYCNSCGSRMDGYWER